MSNDETQDLTQLEAHPEVDIPECLAIIEIDSLDEVTPSGGDIPVYPGRDIVVGRDPSKCQHVIMDERVSKQHFRIYSILYEAQSSNFPPLIYCEDLESYNGTYANGDLIGKIAQERMGYLLCDGDVIEIRPYWRFRFRQTDHQLSTRSKAEWDDLKYFQDRYQVSERTLGEGQYGGVFLATELDTRKQLACKIIDLERAMKNLGDRSVITSARERWESRIQYTSEQKRRVLREIKILAKLSHPNVINLKKAFCSSHALYLFFDLSTGGDLYSYMQAHGGYLDEYNARFIIYQVTTAVQYLHSNGVTHRDIKPENILVSQTFFGGRVVLTDFGFAICMGAGAGRMMSKLGTEGYAAPEVEAVETFSAGYTQAADLWSLGILTACILTGECNIPPQEIVQPSLEISKADNIWRELQPRVQRFIRKLLILDAQERMTANDAIDHSWFTKPRREADALREGIKKINKFWQERNQESEVLEAFPGVVISMTANHTNSTLIPKYHKKLPDVSLSPYFGLDRHLYQNEEPTRKRILEDLSESGSQFVTVKESSSTKIIDVAYGLKKGESVRASDIFGPASVDTEQDELDHSVMKKIRVDSASAAWRTDIISRKTALRYAPGQELRERMKGMNIKANARL
ncbi:kinase-like domain-containing protein [Bisporella sp. PMI_857]|nr:kinase-like domain-containing protein [Bisporella sp. PMI_857]